MNKSYRSVWNPALGAWVAVSEITAARGKRCGGLGSLVVAAGLSVLAASGAAQTVNYSDGADLGAPIDTTPSDVTLNSLGSGTATQSGLVSGTNGIIKTGAGIVVLGASNTYQGSTTINAGALQVSTDANLGAGAGIAFGGGALRLGADNFSSSRAIVLGAAGGTVDVAGTQANTLAGQITGSGVLTLRNTGTNALGSETQRLSIDNAANDYTGGTVLQGNGTAGRLNVWTHTAGSFGSGAITILENAELRFQDATASAGDLAITVPVGVNTNVNGSNSGLQFQNGANAGTATITNNGAGSYVLFGGGGASAQQATLNNNGGRLIFQETSTGGTATINNNSGTLQMANTADLSFATVVNHGEVYVNDISAPAAAIGSLSGSGTVVLGNATLQVGALGQDDTISGVISNTGLGSQDKNGSLYINPVMIGNGAVVKVGAGTLTLTGNNTYTGGTTISGGALQLGAGTASGSVQGNIAIGSGASLIVNRSDDITLSNALSGDGALAQSGPGTTTIGTANTYTGGTTLNAGGLTITAAGALGTGAVTINGGTFGTQVQLDNAVVVNNSFNVAPVGSSTWTGPVTLNADATLTHVAPLGSIVFAGSIGGAHGITLDGAGGGWSGYAYNAVNTYTGTTTVQGNANLLLAAAGTVPADLVVNGSGTVLVNGNGRVAPTANLTVNSTGNVVAGQPMSGVEFLNATQTIAQLNGSGTVGLNGSELTVGAGNFSGAMSNGVFMPGPPPGAGSLVKAGAGTLTLSGANTYTGSTTVAGGTLRAGAANTLSAASAHSVAAGATLDLAGFSQSMASLSNGGTVSLAGAAPGTTLTVNGPYVGNNGTLRLGTTLGASGPSDRLVLDGATAVASGSTTVQITNLGGLGGQTVGSGIEVITALNGATTTAQTTKNAFALGGAGHVGAGAFEYRLYAADASGAGENWYLRSEVIPPPPAPPPPPPGPPAPPAPPAPAPAPAPVAVTAYRAEAPMLAALPSQLRRTDLAMIGSLRSRLGDDDASARAIASLTPVGGALSAERRAWARAVYSDVDIRQSGVVTPSTQGRVAGVQAGTDLYVSQLGDWHAGVYVGTLEGDADLSGFASGAFRPVGSTDLRARYLGAYASYANATGFYVDTVLQYGAHRYTIRPLGGLAASGKGNSLTASVEVGQAFALGGGWTIEPQAQLSYRKARIDDLAISGALVQQDDSGNWTAGLGVRVKGDISTAAGRLQPYARVGVVRGSGGSDVARFVNGPFVTPIGSTGNYTSVEVAGGATLSLSKTVSLYGEVGKVFSAGGDTKVKSSVQGAIGVRVRW